MPANNVARESLMSKFKAHYKKNNHPLTPEFVIAHAVPMFFFTILGTWVIGIADVLPTIYKDKGPTTVLLQRLFVSFLFAEMMMNWLCIRYVDSSYTQYKKSGQGQSVDVEGAGDCKRKTSVEDDENGSRIPHTTGLRERFIKPSSMDFSGSASKDKTGVKSLKYPYWSWSPCFQCDVMRPPRCHHCALCKTCILKRDHHCYFAGTCVGWRNLRHFVIFCLWAALACSYALVHALYYIYHYLWSKISFLDFIPPITVLRTLLGYVSPIIVIYMSVTCFLFYFAFLSVSFLLEHSLMIKNGMTSFEHDNLNRKKIEIHDSRHLSGRLRSVFGANWGLSVFLPLHNVYPPTEDPLMWPTIKVQRHTSE